jgi:hypothetical protein
MEFITDMLFREVELLFFHHKYPTYMTRVLGSMWLQPIFIAVAEIEQ